MTDAQILETEAWAIARCVRGCTTDDQYVELIEKIATALSSLRQEIAAKDAELAEAWRQVGFLEEKLRQAEAEIEETKTKFLPKYRTAITQLAEANKALDEVAGCFDAAYAEGLQERLNDEVERDPGSLHDLITRRLLYALSATRRAWQA